MEEIDLEQLAEAIDAADFAFLPMRISLGRIASRKARSKDDSGAIAYGQAVAHLRSPCPACDPDGAIRTTGKCVDNCEKIRAQIDALRQDTRFADAIITKNFVNQEIIMPELSGMGNEEEIPRRIESKPWPDGVKACNHHPDRPQHKGRGLCLECLQEGGRAAAKRRMAKKESEKLKEVTPAVRKAPGNESVVLEAGPSCKNHPDRAAQLDVRGISTGSCPECLSARGKKAGENLQEMGRKNVVLPLAKPRLADLRQWLAEQAENNERTLAQEIIFILRQAQKTII